MNARIKQYLLIAVAAVALYFVLTNHFIFYGTAVHLLKKSSPNLHYTFYRFCNFIEIQSIISPAAFILRNDCR